MEEEAKANLDELKRKIEQTSSELKKINEEKELEYVEKNKLDRLLFSFIKKANEIRDQKTHTDINIKQLKKSREGLNAELKNLFGKLKNIQYIGNKSSKPSSENLKKQINVMQFAIETEALSFEREKAYMDKIRLLRKQIMEAEKDKTSIKDPKLFKDVIFTKKKVADETHEKIITLATESSKNFENLTGLSRKISDIKRRKTDLQNSLKIYKLKIDNLNQALEAYLQEWAKIVPNETIGKPSIDMLSRLRDKKTLTKDDILELQKKIYRKR
ncbi:MAG: hypothetical protein J4472_00440 [DPANN group archaeon]|nr:hypothetical protein [DPANN group archaeon]